MNPRRFTILACLFFSMNSLLLAQQYTIAFESNGKMMAVIELSIGSDEATTKVAGITERFDLKNQRWQQTDTKQWVSLSQCETWAKQSKKASAASEAAIPEKLREFVQWSLDPKFKVEETDTTLTLTSGQVDYKITAKKTDRDLTNFFRYARLNAYKKAMTERKLPPFAELKVLEALESRKMTPVSMEVRIPGVAGAPTINIAYNENAK